MSGYYDYLVKSLEGILKDNVYTNVYLPPGNYQISTTSNTPDPDDGVVTNAQDYFDRFYGSWDMSVWDENKEDTKSCLHDFTTYNGFIEKYEYCKKCDKKRDDINGQ